MRLNTYPAGTVRALLETDLVTPATRRALRARLDTETAGSEPAPPRYFDAGTFATLRGVCDCLIPQHDRPAQVDLAGVVDRRLAAGTGNGWRYAALPPDGDAYRAGLRGLDEAAVRACGRRFSQADPVSQARILSAVQRDEVSGGVWETLSPRRFLEELLAEVCEAYYSHPLVQEAIGYAGMADAAGWPAIGLNQLAPHEPRAAGEPE